MELLHFNQFISEINLPVVVDPMGESFFQIKPKQQHDWKIVSWQLARGSETSEVASNLKCLHEY